MTELLGGLLGTLGPAGLAQGIAGDGVGSGGDLLLGLAQLPLYKAFR